jgi:hypothetical protein
MKINFLSVFLILLSPFFIYANDNLIPSEFKYNGVVYKYDRGFKEFESFAKEDIDGDGEKETIISFQAREGDANIGVPVAFVFIFDEENIVKIPLGDYPGKIESYDLDKDGDKELILYSHGGAHYTNIDVYDYRNGKPIPIFENGSACPVEFLVEDDIPMIKIGRANWEKEGWSYANGDYLWQVYVWNGEKFIYSKDLSTVPEISEEEEVKRYIDQCKKLLLEREEERKQ